MFIVECLPFVGGLNKESLSYFGLEYLEPGSLLKINIRGKNVPALVLKSVAAKEMKSEIKSADFQLKKISALTAKPFLQKEFLEGARDTAEYFSAVLGGVLSHLIPSFILENPSIFPSTSREKRGGTSNRSGGIKKEISALQAPKEERLTLYKSLVREEFAGGKSVFMCLPQNEDIREVKEKLERGIESFVCAFHNEMSKKDLNREWKRVNQTSHPMLIIGTAQWLFIPREDLGAIIIDKENGNGWKTLSRPFIDLRFFAETLAKKKNIRAVIGDAFLRTETLYRYKQGEMAEFESVKWRLPSEIRVAIVDLKENNKKEKEFRTLSPKLLGLIKENIEKGSNMFIFAARKGISSVTVCRDCGEQVKCSNCSAPMVLYRTNLLAGRGGAFKCHQCGETRDAAEVCQNCRSWRLTAFGAGIDRVAAELRKSILDINLFEIHKDVTPTGARAFKVVESFYESRGSVLLGTEMAFSYLHKKVGNTAIASFDSLFSIPDFRIREKIFRLILQARDMAKRNFLIQTRNPGDSTIEFAATGNLIEFYKKEIEERKSLSYPPFGTFIKITVRGTKSFVAKESERLKRVLSNYNPAVFSSVHEKKGKQAAINVVIKLPTNKWPKVGLWAILKALPPHFEIKVDPDNLL